MKEKNKSEKLEKIKILSIWVLSILLIISILQRTGIFGDSFKIGKNISKNLLNNGDVLILEDGMVSKTVNSSNWDASKVTATKDADGKEVPVPKGYVGSQVAGENTINGGYVIYEGTEAVTSSNVAVARKSRNQWVWVPVPYPDRIYEEVNGVKKAKLYTYSLSGRSEYPNLNYEPAVLIEEDTITNFSTAGLSGMTPDKLYQELQQEFDSTVESIKKYGGFYIGRYETGNLSQSKPVIRRMNTDIGNQNWYTMYRKMGYLAANENVKTNIIWGCLWDETLQYMLDRRNKNYISISNSKDWGNHLNSVFTYVTDSGSTVNKTGGVKIATGSSESTKALNIYDMAGNVYELTLEGAGSLSRISRGGAYGTSSTESPVATRVSRSTLNYNEAIRCSCLSLYKINNIKI